LQEHTKVPLPRAILNAFLPAGFPHSVTEDYFAYQMYDSLQAFSSSIASLLANRAVLEGLGVGDSGASATGAMVLKIIQDTFSRVATIWFAHRMGTAIEPECKYYRFLADIFNDAGQILDLVTPVLPYAPKLSVMVSASILRALCGVAAAASKASLSAHFAKTGNLAELNAKEQSQETVISLLGMLVGTLFVKIVEGKQAVWTWMLILIFAHLATNYKAVRSVKMRSLNRQRATIVFREWLETNTILTPAQASQRESILRKTSGNLASKTGDYTGYCEFTGYGGVMGWHPRGYHRYVFDTPKYVMGIWHSGGNFYIRIALKESTPNPLTAWFDAVAHAYHLDTALKDDPNGHHENELPHGYVSDEAKEAVFAALEKAGWDTNLRALEIKSPVRVRTGESKKGM
jgi:hypothetical protein